jgi:hypothetical protein
VTLPLSPTPRQHAASEAERAAAELETAAAHLRRAAHHALGGEMPRYAAHLLATQGHLISAEQVLDDLAVTHAQRTQGEDA